MEGSRLVPGALLTQVNSQISKKTPFQHISYLHQFLPNERGHSWSLLTRLTQDCKQVLGDIYSPTNKLTQKSSLGAWSHYNKLSLHQPSCLS